jgi:type VI secretion system secreted protein VgrG
MTVAQNYRETVEANQTVTIAANETFAAEKSRTKTVGGDEAVTIGGARNIKTGGQHTTSVTLARKLSVGPAIIDVSLGQISADAHTAFHVLVGGAVVRLAKSGLQEECGKIGVQTIGAARVEIAGEQRTLDVRKMLFETVAGALVIRANKQFLDTADQKFSMKVGATLTTKAPDVWIEAQDEIVVKCGPTSIKVTKDKIELSTPKLDLSGATGIEHKTAVVEHN